MGNWGSNGIFVCTGDDGRPANDVTRPYIGFFGVTKEAHFVRVLASWLLREIILIPVVIKRYIAIAEGY